jgi:GDP-L-fucose synthase
MNILVTGASGFLGVNLCKVLNTDQNNLVELSSKNCDLTIDGNLSAFNSIKYDFIYHLAAWTQAGDFCLYHPGEQWIKNQQINTNVLNWWHQSQPQAKLVFMGTSCSYAPELSLVEENYLEGTPIDSLFTYAMTKRMLHVGAMALAKQYGLKYLCAVPSTLYGPNYHTDGRQMHFIFDLIRKIIRGAEYGEDVILWGDGYQKRELVYIDDFVRTLITLSSNSENDLINIGAGEEYSIRDFAKEISRIVGYDDSLIKYDTNKYVGAKSKFLDTSKLNKIIPNLKNTSLNQGLKETIDWFIKVKAY